MSKIYHLAFIIYHSQKCKGFTLIEVLVAATIVGILSTIGVTGFQAVTRNGRDALRKSDLEQIRSALEIYKSEKTSYPGIASECVADNLTPSYVNTYPSDPRPSQYRYCYIPDPLSTLKYTLCAHLENGSPGDLSSDCGSKKCYGTGGTEETCNYKVNNP